MKSTTDDLIKVYTHSIFVAASRGELTEDGISTTLKMLADKAKEKEQPKPRTKTEYVKCEADFFDLKDDFRGKRLFFNDGTYNEPKYEMVMDIKELSHYFLKKGLFRKVEKEIDWREEVNDFFLKAEVLGTDHLIANGIDMKELNSEFIATCRLVESLTRHIEV